jgi:hypothetical protein
MPLVSHRMPYTQAPRAFEMATAYSEGAIKILLSYA